MEESSPKVDPDISKVSQKTENRNQRMKLLSMKRLFIT